MNQDCNLYDNLKKKMFTTNFRAIFIKISYFPKHVAFIALMAKNVDIDWKAYLV